MSSLFLHSNSAMRFSGNKNIKHNRSVFVLKGVIMVFMMNENQEQETKAKPPQVEWQYIEPKEASGPITCHRIKIVYLLCPFTCRMRSAVTVSLSPGYNGEDHPRSKCSRRKFRSCNMPSLISSQNMDAHLHKPGFHNAKSKPLRWEDIKSQIW